MAIGDDPLNVDLRDYLDRRGIKLVPKRRSWTMRTLGRLLRVVGNDRFMTSQWTTIGADRVYYPERAEGRVGDLERFRPTLIHELTHTEQARWVGLFQLTYLLLPIPVLLAFGRAWLEWRCYRYDVAYWPHRKVQRSVAPPRAPKRGALDEEREAAIAWIARSLWRTYLAVPPPVGRWMGRSMVRRLMERRGML